MAKADPKKLKAGSDYLSDILRTAYGTHSRSVDAYTKYTKADAIKHARQGISKLGIQSGAKEGGKRVVNIVTEAAEGYIRDDVTGKPTRTGGSYINIDDAKAAIQAQVDEALEYGVKQKKVGLKIGETIGRIAGAQVAKTAAADAAPGLIKQGVKQGFKAGARAMFGPAAGAALIAEHLVSKGYDRATSPDGKQFHTSTGVPYWQDRNVKNRGTKLNPDIGYEKSSMTPEEAEYLVKSKVGY